MRLSSPAFRLASRVPAARLRPLFLALAALAIAPVAKAAPITWDLSNVVIAGYSYFGSVTVDSNGLATSADISVNDLYTGNVETMSTDPSASPQAALTYVTNNEFIDAIDYQTGLVVRPFGVFSVDLVLTPGETFADNVETLQLSGVSNSSGRGCCGYLTSGTLVNEALAAPEPASLALFGVGATVLGVVRRRRG